MKKGLPLLLVPGGYVPFPSEVNLTCQVLLAVTKDEDSRLETEKVSHGVPGVRKEKERARTSEVTDD